MLLQGWGEEGGEQVGVSLWEERRGAAGSAEQGDPLLRSHRVRKPGQAAPRAGQEFGLGACNPRPHAHAWTPHRRELGLPQGQSLGQPWPREPCGHDSLRAPSADHLH